MVDGAASRHLVTLALAALVFSGCLDDAPKEGLEGPADSTPGDAGPVDSTPGGDAEPVEVYSPGWPNLGEAVVRPGVKIAGPNTSGDCTANFVFSTPDNHTLYLGTASHCFVGVAIGDPVSIAFGAVTGTLVYCSWGTVDGTATCPDKNGLSEGFANDFALLELPDDTRTLVHPAMLHWGGPTGILKSSPGENEHVLNYGNSSLRDADQNGPGSDAADAREGITAAPVTPFAGPPEWTTYVRFAGLGVHGDSGSGVMLADGTAFGILNAITAFEGANAVTNLSPAVEYVHNNTDLRIELKTWVMLADPIVPFSAPDEGAPRRSAER